MKESQGFFPKDATRGSASLLPAPARRTGETRRTVGRDGEERKKIAESRAESHTRKAVAYPVAEYGEYYGFAAPVSFWHCSTCTSLAHARVVSTPRPRRLCPLRNPIRSSGTLRSKSDSRRLARPRTKDHTQGERTQAAIYPRDFTD